MRRRRARRRVRGMLGRVCWRRLAGECVSWWVYFVGVGEEGIWGMERTLSAVLPVIAPRAD